MPTFSFGYINALKSQNLGNLNSDLKQGIRAPTRLVPSSCASRNTRKAAVSSYYLNKMHQIVNFRDLMKISVFPKTYQIKSHLFFIETNLLNPLDCL